MEKHTSSRERDVCWAARDAFYDCLEKEKASAPGGDGGACGSLRQAYERSCLASWRRYWDERHRNGRPIVGRSPAR